MSKYVPSFLRGATVAPAPAPAESAFRSFVREDPVVVNTSLPARTAVPLPAATLASLTVTEKAVPVEPTRVDRLEPLQPRTKRMPLPKEDDFPTLGGKTAKLVNIPVTTSFRDLSQSWAEKQRQQAEEATAAREKERAVVIAAAEAARRAADFRIITVKRAARVGSDGEEEEEEEESPVEESEPSEEEVEDEDWVERRSRYDLY